MLKAFFAVNDEAVWGHCYMCEHTQNLIIISLYAKKAMFLLYVMKSGPTIM